MHTIDYIIFLNDFDICYIHFLKGILLFGLGVSTMSCDVKIIDDSKFEDSEEFIVQLEDASSGSRIGKYLQVY